MRLLEILIFIFLGLGLLRLLIASIQGKFRSPWFEIGTLILIACHLILEGYRWQMLPGYALTLLLLAINWFSSRSNRQIKWSRWWSLLSAVLIGTLYLGSILLPTLLPVPRITPPSGPYAVGTRTWHWIDETRIDPYAPTAGESREIMVQAWYPINPEDQDKRSPWMAAAEIVAPAVAEWIDLPPFFLDHLVYVTTQATLDAPIASRELGFPVLLFSHGFGGFRAQNTNQMQYLASHGFIVIAAEHTYASVVSVFPDGHIALHNPDTLPDDLPPAEDIMAARALGDQWASDLSFVLDQLSTGNLGEDHTAWHAAIDLENIGAFGHSTGGGAAIEFCNRDHRCQATLTMDPFVKPVSAEAMEQGLPHYALHMFSEVWTSSENLDRLIILAQSSDVKPLIVNIRGSDHYDFSDLPLLTPLAHAIGLKGPIKGARMTEIVNKYLLAYFEQALAGKQSDLLRGETVEYPEVIYTPPAGSP